MHVVRNHAANKQNLDYNTLRKIAKEHLETSN